MAPATRRVGTQRLENDERRAQLLAVGRELFSSSPYDAISIEEIARRVGISRGLLYHYFPSKRDFYVAVVQLAADELVARLQPAPELPPLQQLRVNLQAYVAFVRENSAGFVTLLRGGIGHDNEVLAVVDGTRAALLDKLLAGMGVPEPDPMLRLTVRGWLGFVESVSLDWLTLPPDQAPDEETLVSLFSSVLTSAVNELGSPPAVRS